MNIAIPKTRAPIKVNAFRPTKTENATKIASYFGKLRSNRSSTLGFPIGGEVATVSFAQTRIAAGSVIAELDASQLKEDRLRLSDQLGNLSESLRSTDRAQQLENQIAAIDQQIQQQTMTAPFDCVVEEVFVTQGSLVRAKSPVVSIVETSLPIIEINLPRSYATLIDPSTSYVFLLDGVNLKAVVRNRSFTENPPGIVKTTFDIESDLSKVNFYLEQSVEARFSFPTGKSGFWLPMTSVQKNSVGLWSVMVVETVDGKQKVLQRPVEIEDIRDDAALVSGELENQLIVRDGVHRIVAGQIVDVNEVTFDGDEIVASRSE